MAAPGLARRRAGRRRLKPRAGETLRALIQASPAAIVCLDAATRVTLWNPAAERIFGWREAEILGQPIPIVPPELEGEFWTLNAAILRGELICDYETQRLKKTGERIDVSLSTAPLGSPANPSGVMGILSDIGERKRGERERERLLTELSEAVRSREALIAVASHEIKTPLTSLKLQVQRLARAVRAGAPPGDLPGTLAAIDTQVDRLNQLLDDLLDFSRAASGRLEITREEVDLAQIARAVAARAKEPLAQSGSALKLRASTPVVGRWDRLRLEQVAVNLLSNAIKYGRGRPIELSVFAEGGRAYLAVKDCGEGIPPEARERIFERFTRASPNSRVSGVGLGLWIVKQIVDALGGSIAIESEVGRGSTFTVSLPF